MEFKQVYIATADIINKRDRENYLDGIVHGIAIGVVLSVIAYSLWKVWPWM